MAHGPIEYEEFSKRSILTVEATLTGTTTSIQSGPGSNGKERVHHIPPISNAFCSPSDAVSCVIVIFYSRNNFVLE